jgi:hypothetical protein
MQIKEESPGLGLCFSWEKYTGYSTTLLAGGIQQPDALRAPRLSDHVVSWRDSAA